MPTYESNTVTPNLASFGTAQKKKLPAPVSGAAPTLSSTLPPGMGAGNMPPGDMQLPAGPPGVGGQAGDMMLPGGDPSTLAPGETIGMDGSVVNAPLGGPTSLADQPTDMQLPGGDPGLTDAGGGTAPLTTADLVGQFQEQADAANLANEERYGQAVGIYDDLIGGFGQGGTMEAAATEGYRRQKERDLAQQQQQLISSGLFNTTIAAGAPAAYEEQVGVPFRLGLAESMAQRKAGAMTGKAGVIERRTDEAPDPALMAGLVQGASAGPEEAAAGTVADEVIGTEDMDTTTTEGLDVPSLSDVMDKNAFTPKKAQITISKGLPSKGGGGGGAMSSKDFAKAATVAGGGVQSSSDKPTWKAMTAQGRPGEYKNRHTGEIVGHKEYKKRVAGGLTDKEQSSILDSAKSRAGEGGKVAYMSHEGGGFSAISFSAGQLKSDPGIVDRMKKLGATVE